MISYVRLVYHIWYHMWYILYHKWYNRLMWYHNISCDITTWYHIWYHVWYGFTHSLGHVILRFFHDILYDIMLFWRYHMTQRMGKTISHMITYVISCNFAWYHHYVISHNCDVIELYDVISDVTWVAAGWCSWLRAPWSSTSTGQLRLPWCPDWIGSISCCGHSHGEWSLFKFKLAGGLCCWLLAQPIGNIKFKLIPNLGLLCIMCVDPDGSYYPHVLAMCSACC
jgi:hypothetical protein